MPDDQRTPIEMAYFGGFTQFSAQRLKQPLGTVKTRIRRMIRLREQLGGVTARQRRAHAMTHETFREMLPALRHRRAGWR